MPGRTKPNNNVQTPDPEAIEAIELPLLLEAMAQRYGYDFRDYAVASLMRRLRRAMDEEGLRTLSAFQDRVLHDPKCMARALVSSRSMSPPCSATRPSTRSCARRWCRGCAACRSSTSGTRAAPGAVRLHVKGDHLKLDALLS